jgi:CHU_C Type IX secretion signal domain
LYFFVQLLFDVKIFLLLPQMTFILSEAKELLGYLQSLFSTDPYGQKIFEINNPSTGWNGTYKNSKQSMGGYIYQYSYRFAGKPQQMLKGYFLLIR